MPLSNGWKENNTIGINASPLILTSGSEENVVLEAYRKMIQTMLETTDSNVALIPHVVWKNNNDQIVLKQLYEGFKKTGRVILLSDYNSMQLKGFIARCRLFVGARTHATIAAYSSGVPTLVLGYSVKSKGIARDIFGTEENYVIPVQNMTNTSALSDGFLWLLENEKDIRVHLESIIPEYIKKAYYAGVLIKELQSRR